ncbi:putative Cinnamate beta-D-glucosyltransferase [Hypsibius exemplaris]|uniref:Cinnamate beta-D-glucosyltransferase n=1 Tax=Hypsibius exemplaris TaxID=2072580 RepID=A0A9X6NAM4_HYPEX|nr:putative Cinnamate beta-D-glucosyltransferase [Hypsibius exemplaris]
MATSKHILLIAYPEFGHIIPLLELGKKLAQHRHKVTFAVSEYFIDKIVERQLVPTGTIERHLVPTERQLVPTGTLERHLVPTGTLERQLVPTGTLERQLVPTGTLELVGIPDGYSEDLFDCGINMVPGRGFQIIQDLTIPGARNFLKFIPTRGKSDEVSSVKEVVDLVVGDSCVAAALTILYERDVPYYFFNSASAASMTLSPLYVDDKYPTTPEDQENSLSKPAKVSAGDPTVVPISMAGKRILLPINQTMHLVQGILVNSVRELELETVEEIRTFPVMKDIPIWFVGPLFPETEEHMNNSENRLKVAKWLDEKKDLSVVYVSFGTTTAPPQPGQIAQLGKALLRLDCPFIWSLPAKQYQHLPDGFPRDPAGHFDGKVVVLPWAPQKLILQHPATAVFLTHCGWNCTVESVTAGVPVVAWPMSGDQQTNAEWLVEHGLGELVPGRGHHSARIVPAGEIEGTLRRVGTEGSVFRQAARAWKKVADGAVGAGGSSETELADFLQRI